MTVSGVKLKTWILTMLRAAPATAKELADISGRPAKNIQCMLQYMRKQNLFCRDVGQLVKVPGQPGPAAAMWVATHDR